MACWWMTAHFSGAVCSLVVEKNFSRFHGYGYWEGMGKMQLKNNTGKLACLFLHEYLKLNK